WSRLGVTGERRAGRIDQAARDDQAVTDEAGGVASMPVLEDTPVDQTEASCRSPVRAPSHQGVLPSLGRPDQPDRAPADRPADRADLRPKRPCTPSTLRGARRPVVGIGAASARLIGRRPNPDRILHWLHMQISIQNVGGWAAFYLPWTHWPAQRAGEASG